jgi:hypothetical protein
MGMVVKPPAARKSFCALFLKSAAFLGFFREFAFEKMDCFASLAMTGEPGCCGTEKIFGVGC